ncbi:MAG: peptidoglycan DD-metalloendopeptidase family protein [Pyrinomonadaceae bacterium]
MSLEIGTTENRIGIRQPAEPLSRADELRIRDKLSEFEAVLLNQITSALNRASSDDDSLFGSDSGTDLAKNLYSEQLSLAMAKSGGFGIADKLLSQFGLEPESVKASKMEISPLPKNPASNAPVDLIVQKPLGDFTPTDDGSEIGVVSVDQDTVDDQVWRAPFVDPKYGIDVTKPENQIPSTSLRLPVEGRISSRFGSRFHPIDKTQKFHKGIDIAAPAGTPIRAAAGGVVKFSGVNGGYGNMVVIDHGNGLVTKYGHASTLKVVEGQEVSPGEIIGTVGSTGKSTGPHVHFEVLENGVAVNPLELLAKVSTREPDK